MTEVELREIFEWTCPTCGRVNRFYPERVQVEVLLEPEEREDDDDPPTSHCEFSPQPRTVLCPGCKERFANVAYRDLA